MGILATGAAVASIPVLLLESQWSDFANWTLLAVLNWAIWLIFGLDTVVAFGAAGTAVFRRGSWWFGTVVTVLTFPLLLPALSGLRLLRLSRAARATRLARALRLTRFLAIGSRSVTGLRRVLDPNALPFVSLFLVLIITVGGAALYMIELESDGIHGFGDAVWWAIVTVTTVGYGDITPSSTSGRVIAVIVMLVGIAFTSLLTAQIAAYLTRQDQDELERDIDADIARLEAKLDLLTQMVQEQGHLRGSMTESDSDTEADTRLGDPWATQTEPSQHSSRSLRQGTNSPSP